MSIIDLKGVKYKYQSSNEVAVKDINLEISLILRDLLIAENVTVGMSRETDIPLSLMDRVRMSNNFGADIFISIHNNATHDPDTGGTMVLFPAKDIRAQNLAAIISAEISNRLGTRNIGAIERNDVLVVREPKATSVLVEAVFMTNPEEEQMIIQQENQILVAEAIIAALKIHIQEFQEFYKRRPLITRPSFLVPALGLIGGGIYHYFRREG